MKKIAHFTSTETLITKILPSRNLRGSDLTKLNDPTENKWLNESIFSYSSPDGCNPPSEYESFYKEHSPKIGKHIKIFCFSSYEHQSVETQTFSCPHLNLRMWSQYGNAHTGACIVFKKSELIERARSSFANLIYEHDVMYNSSHNTFPLYTTHDISNFNSETMGIADFFHQSVFEDAKNSPYVLFQKRIDWRDELEYRIAIYDPSTEYSYLDIEDLIEEIYFGLKTEGEYIKIIKQRYPAIILKQLVFENHEIICRNI